MKSGREHIVTILVDMEKDESYIQLLLKEALEKVEVKDKAFVNEVVYGTTKYRLRLDYVINQFSKTPVKKMKPFIRQIMRMSVYQLLFLDKVPESAIINEAVKLVHKRKMSNLSGFVNGVLRQVARQKEVIAYPDYKKEPVHYLSVFYSVPEWIVSMWCETYGYEESKNLLEALNERASVCIRRNTMQVTETVLLEHLKDEGIEVRKKGIVKEAYLVQGTGNVGKRDSYQKGEWTVQDESAMLVGHVVAPQKNERVLDMCSAPGGKTTHLGILMENTGEVIGTDVHEHKIQLIEKNAERLGLTNVTGVCQDGTVKKEAWKASFDRVLLDAPCSGLGIIKRKPDIRYSKTPEDLKEIVKLQRQLVENAIYYLKPGGILVYSTCTLNTDENEGMVAYAEEAFDMVRSSLREALPECLKESLKDDAYIEILPHQQGSDGFFIAKLEKRK